MNHVEPALSKWHRVDRKWVVGRKLSVTYGKVRQMLLKVARYLIKSLYLHEIRLQMRTTAECNVVARSTVQLLASNTQLGITLIT